jgi:lysophospholipase L1-like esterase
MKTILCYGDSNVRGFMPGTFNIKTRWSERYPKNKRWTGILQKKLGENYDVVEEGIGGRTTSFDEIIPGRPFRNGLNELPMCLESHYPIDLVVFMLGTNDTKLQFNNSATDIAEGMRKLIHIVKASNKGPSMSTPKILLLAPQPILKLDDLHDQFDESSIKNSCELAGLYQRIAIEEKCEFLDASLIVISSKIDGIHLDEPQCILLGNAVAEKIAHIFVNEI